MVVYCLNYSGKIGMKPLNFIILIVSSFVFVTKALAASSEFTSHIVVELKNNEQVIDSGAQMYRLSEDKVLLRQHFSSLKQYLSLLEKLSNNTSIKTINSSLLVADSNASYLAKEHRLKPEQRDFIKVQRLYVKNGHADEISNLMAKYKTAFTANNIKRDVLIYRGISGQDLPYIEIVRFAKTEQDDAQYEEKVNQAFGKELLVELSTSFGKFIRKGDASLNGIKIKPLN